MRRTTRILAAGLAAPLAALAQTPESVEATFTARGVGDHAADAKAAGPTVPDPNDGNGVAALLAGQARPENFGAPPNDNCANATIIPGSIITYSPPLLNTVDALTELCEAQESCEAGAAGVSDSVWYRYTPVRDGFVEINTLGSNYNTVLSVFDGCRPGGLPPCGTNPTELACNDDYFFGTTSLVNLEVAAGQTYVIKVADHDSAGGGGLLDFHLTWRPLNQLCARATPIVGVAYSDEDLPTPTAQVETCDGNESCEFNGVGTSNSVWYSFLAPCDGFISVNTNGSDYDTVLAIFDGCPEFVGIDTPCAEPTEIACDDDAGTGTNSQLVNVPVIGGVEYRIKVADYNPSAGGGLLDFHFLFEHAAPPVARLLAPDNFACACDPVPVEATVLAGGALAGWKLEYQPIALNSWTLIASGTNEATSATLANWNTGGLAQGYCLLRLTVENACGATETDVAVVWIDRFFDDLTVVGPGPLAGGLVCISGTASDNLCFDSYTVEYRPSGGGAYQPVDPGQPLYTAPRINQTLALWDTGGLGLPDGDYDLLTTAFTECGDVASDARTVAVDNTPPFVEITLPVSCSTLAGKIEVTGTVSDAHLGGWALQYTGGGTNAWVTIASGSTNVINDLLGVWDVSALPQCAYTLRLIASDQTPLNCNGAIVAQSEFLVSAAVSPGGLCAADIDGNGVVGFDDLLILLGAFGLTCP